MSGFASKTCCGIFLSAISAMASAQLSPSDFETPEFYRNWGLNAIGAQYAYAKGFTGAGVKVGIADDPAQLSHPEFLGRVSFPVPFPLFPVPGFPVPDHGTHVMGIAAAARNGQGMMGVAYDALLVNVAAVDNPGYSSVSDWSQAIIDAGARVVNGSFGLESLPKLVLPDDTINPDYIRPNVYFATVSSAVTNVASVQDLAAADVVVLFSSGNARQYQNIARLLPTGFFKFLPLVTPANTLNGQLYKILNDDVDPYRLQSWTEEDLFPLDRLIPGTDLTFGELDFSSLAGSFVVVAAVDEQLQIADFSNYCGLARAWCIAEPGVNIYSTVPMNSYGFKEGTSMASPHAAGAAAVLLQAFPYMNARQIIEVMLTTATDLGEPGVDNVYGHGLLNLQRAVQGPVVFGLPLPIDPLDPDSDPIFAPIFAVDTQGYDSVWSNNITGAGGFSKAGAGMLTLTGNNSYTGTTTITGGILRVDGSIASSELTVAQAATLQGVGTVGNTLLAGVLSPGNSVGKLTVQGDLTLQDGATYLYEIDANQNGDLVVVTGTTTIADGAIFELSAEDGVYLNQLYPMIQSGTLNGTFENLHTNYTFIDLDFIVTNSGTGSELGVVAERNTVPMASFAQTNNQRAVATAIDGQSGLDEPYNDVLLNDNPSALPGWYQDWSGEIYSANQAALLYNSRLLAQVVNWRLQDSWLDNNQAVRLQQVGQTNADTTVWAQAYGNWDKFSANADAQKATANSGGFVLGVDHQLNPSLRLGGGFSASVTNTTVAASNADTSGYHLLAYGTYDTEHLRLNGGLVQSWYTANVNRTLPLDDQGNANGTVASRSTQLFADLSTPITLHRQEDTQTTLWPFGQVSQTWLSTSNFGETGAEAALSGQATNASVGFGTLGARLTHQWQSQETIWQASLSAGWQRAWGDLSPTTTLAFATGPDFSVAAAPIAREAAVVEVGIGASLGPSSRFNLVYSTTLAGQSSSQMLQAQLQWWF